MASPQNELKKSVLIAAAVCAVIYLFINRSFLLFIPVFGLVIYTLWKKGGGRFDSWEDDDPADWWKKGKHWGGWRER